MQFLEFPGNLTHAMLVNVGTKNRSEMPVFLRNPMLFVEDFSAD